jgi:hypothetical protein
MRAVTNLRPSAMVAAYPMSGEAPSRALSIAAGARFLPPEVIMMSFLRPTIRQ